MNTKHRAILKNQQDEKPRVKQACPQCLGRGRVRDNDPYADRRQDVACPKCGGSGYLGALVALLLLLVCSANAATVNGTVKDRQGVAVSTNVTFKALQRPLFDSTPSVRPGWTVTVWSTNDGTFSTELLAGNYQVTFGGDQKDTFLIEVPTNSAAYDVTALTTNGVRYQYNGTIELTNFVASVNGISTPNQTFATGTSGSDFAISSGGTTHTFHLPTASASNRGALSAADWSDFYARVTQLQLTAESNALVAYAMALSNTVYGLETTRHATVSNAAVAFAMAASNSVYTAETTRNAAVSNGAVSFTLTASNDVYAAETTRNTAVSNAAVAFSMTLSNTLYSGETSRHAAVSNATVAFTMTASNTLYRTGANLTTTGGNKFGLFASLSGNNLQFYGLEAGSNAVLYFNGSNIVIAATGTGGGSPATSFDSSTTTFDSSTVTFDAN